MYCFRNGLEILAVNYTNLKIDVMVVGHVLFVFSFDLALGILIVKGCRLAL